MKHNLRWRLKHAFHNLVAHPLLPLAEALKDIGVPELAEPIYKLHDATNPEDDVRNRQTFKKKPKGYEIN